MNAIGKTKNNLAMLTGVIYFSLIFVGAILVVQRGITRLTPVYLINIGVDLFGMLIGYVIFICCLVDVSRTGNKQKYFMYLINITYFGLFTDLLSWLINGLPEYRIHNLIINTFYYLCMPLGCWFFWRYVTTTLGIEEGAEKGMGNILRFLFAASVFLRILNLFTGCFFTVDADGFYHRSSTWYPFSMVYLFATALAILILTFRNRKKLETHQRVALLLYIFAPTLTGIFTLMFFGLSVSYGVLMAVLLLMYCLINIDQSRKKAVADRELSMAALIQQSMLPHVFPPFPDRKEFDLYASMDPAREVGGDFYDFFFIDKDHLCLVMADVSGKGVPAALFMMISKTILQSCAMLGKSAGEILNKTNEALSTNNQVEMFVTVWVGILEISTGKMTCANAGHEYPVLKTPDGKYELFKDKHGLVIGGMEGTRYKEYEICLQPGSRIFVYTDGVPEATDDANRQFGIDRMLETLNKDPDASPDQVLKNVREAVDGFVSGAVQFDDLTMLCLEYKGIC